MLQYILSRYFSSDIGVEQLNWLIAGCGTNLSMDFVNDTDLIDLSAVTFSDFNGVCLIIPEKPEEIYQRFLTCIENMKNHFQFPQYYNGLVGLLLLFYNDENYELKDPIGVRKAFVEAKQLITTVFEDFEDFTDCAINNHIMVLCEMSFIYMKSNDKELIVSSKRTNNMNTEAECYVNKNGKRVQTRPLNYSSKVTLLEKKLCPTSTVPSQLIEINNTALYEEQIKIGFKRFEKMYGSVTSGYVLSTIMGKQMAYFNKF